MEVAEGDCSKLTQVIETKHECSSNAYLAGVIAAFGIIIGIYFSFGKVKNCVLRHFTVSLCVSGGMLNYYSQDKTYHWMLNWLSANLKDLRHYHISLKTLRESASGKDEETEFKFHPSFGTHIFCYNGQWIKLVREQLPEIRCHEIPWEKLTLSTLKSQANVLNEILIEAKAFSREADETKTSFYVIACGDWTPFGEPKKRRQLSSVILTKGMEQKILGDIKDFLTSENWYMERGIPYRRGYLLYGPPGCGKSSLIKAIAGEIGYDICMLSLSSKDLTDDGLNQLMNTTPAKSIILLEDIDAAFKSRSDPGGSNKETNLAFEGAGSSKVTFRGLLNALDGVASTEGRLVFMTTNYVERLDPALARPGRVDMKILVGLPDTDQIRRMLERFYPGVERDFQNKFAAVVQRTNGEISMAMIQGLFMMEKNCVEDALNYAAEYFKEQHFIQQHELEKQDELDEKDATLKGGT